MACPEQLIFSFAGIAALSTLICINSSILLSRRSQPLFGKESSLSDTLAKALCAMDSFYGGKDANRTGGWHPEPTFRGTFSILSSCLITMLLCIWTSVHLNIPAHGEKGIFRPQTWRKVKWLFIGLFAPEMVAWVALEQQRAALRIQKEMADRAGQTGDSGSNEKKRSTIWKVGRSIQGFFSPKPVQFAERKDWTIIHSHYAAMGGFILNVRGEESEFFVLKTQTQLTIRPEAFPWIIRNAFEAIPDISEDEILDKSKANGLAKFIVCVQATWFCIQCVNRLALSLSISLLELNTFAHAICTLIIYILWWNKPLDVDGTTMLQGQSAKKVYNTLLYSSAASRNGHPTETHAYFLTFTSASLPRRRLKLKSISSEISPDILEPGLHGTNIVDEQPLDVADPTPRNMEFSDPRPPEVSDPRPHSKESSHEQPRAMVRVLPNTKLQHFDVIKAETDCTGPLASLRLPSLKYIDLSPGDFKNLELALDTLVNLEDYIVDITALSSRAPNLPLKTSTTLGLNSFVLSGLCYGSLHLTAWDAPFPTNTQKLLWRISGLSLVASGFLIWAEIYLIGTVAMLLDTPYWTRLRENCSNSYRNKVSKSFQLGLEGTLSLIFVLLHIMAFLLYIFCRVYLIVDCFIVLAHLPESVYRVPKWSQHFPHLR